MTRRWIPAFSVVALAAIAFGCGGNVSSSGGSGGSGTGGSTGGMHTGGHTGGTHTGGAPPSGDCTTEADCNGNPCVEVTPGGFKICTSFPPEATECTPGDPVPDECCTTADCTTGKCYSTQVIPYCGGPAMAIYNKCLSDQCVQDTDCAGGSAPAICTGEGAFGYPLRTCLVAYCKTDADCTAQAGGYCAPVNNPCCSTPSGLGCVYPGGCRKNEDCATDGSQHCELDSSGAGVCKDGPAACPA